MAGKLVQFRVQPSLEARLRAYLPADERTGAPGPVSRALLSAYFEATHVGLRELGALRLELTIEDLEIVMWALQSATVETGVTNWQTVWTDVLDLQRYEARFADDARAHQISAALRSQPLAALALWDLACRYWAADLPARASLLEPLATRGPGPAVP